MRSWQRPLRNHQQRCCYQGRSRQRWTRLQGCHTSTTCAAAKNRVMASCLLEVEVQRHDAEVLYGHIHGTTAVCSWFLTGHKCKRQLVSTTNQAWVHTCTYIFSNIDPVCDYKEMKYLSVKLIQQSKIDPAASINYTSKSASINSLCDFKTKENNPSQTQYIAIFDVV
jgi:hypothetical protein